MSAAIQLAFAGLSRAPARTAIRVLVLATAVALLGAMLLFIGHSLQVMTGSAIRSVALDWQGPVSSYGQAQTVAAGVARQPGIAQASAAATAPFSGVAHVTAAGATNAGSGAILAVAPAYTRAIHTYRLLSGALAPGAILLDQQLAATLQARVGDTVRLTPRRGARPVVLRVSGIGLITAPDLVFAPLNPLLGPAGAQPPANAAIMPLETFARTVAPQLPTLGAGSGTGPSPASSAVPGAQTGVQWQVHVQLRPTGLGATPGQAFTRAGQVVNRVQRTLPGQVQFVDNLSQQLNTAAGDALYAQTLYIMLALPGAIVALGLAYLAALGTVERDRRDLALLRARGATRRQLWVAALVESSLIGVIAGIAGAALALAAVRTVIGPTLALSAIRILAAVLGCAALATAGALAARLAATRSVARAAVSDGRRSVRREQAPLWQRLYLDVLALILSALIYWLTASTGFSAVVNPDSNPTLSLSVYMFFAPALLWVGATLLLVRLRGRGLAWLAARAGGRRAGTASGFLLASAGRRGAAINRGLILVGLLLAFGVNLGLFTATYDQQAAVDAQLTLGADVVTSAAPGVTSTHGLAARIARVPGVQATSPVEHSYAYVGPDLQDTFGIDVATLSRATTLRDSYFLGAGAGQTLARLAHRPDGVLVSKETIADYQLRVGDLLNLRLLDHATGRFRVVPFHVAGVVQEFPSAPRDSFMVANLGYLRQIDRAGGPNAVFARAPDPAATAARVSAATRADGTIVKSIDQQAQQTVSSITTVDLRGISRIEEAFTVVLAAAAMGLFVAIAVIERRQEFATMAALGASLRAVRAFVISEAVLVLVTALALALVLGTLLALMLVAMLQHVFDPPPDALAVPWAFLGELVAAALITTAGAVALSSRRLRRLPLGQILREQ